MAEEPTPQNMHFYHHILCTVSSMVSLHTLLCSIFRSIKRGCNFERGLHCRPLTYIKWFSYTAVRIEWQVYHLMLWLFVLHSSIQATTNRDSASTKLLAELEPCVHNTLQVALQAAAKITEHGGAARENNVLHGSNKQLIKNTDFCERPEQTFPRFINNSNCT